MARETINGISVPIPGTGEPPDFVGDLRQIATDVGPAIDAAVAAANYGLDTIVTATLGPGDTYVLDPTVADQFILTLTGDATLSIPSYAVGQRFLVQINQDGAGGHTLTLPEAAGPTITLSEDALTYELLVYRCWTAGRLDVSHPTVTGPIDLPFTLGDLTGRVFILDTRDLAGDDGDVLPVANIAEVGTDHAVTLGPAGSTTCTLRVENGVPVIEIDGTDYLSTGSSLTAPQAQPVCLFGVAKTAAGPAAASQALISGSSTGNQHTVGVRATGSGGWWYMSAGSTINSTVADDGTWTVVYEELSDSGTDTITVDGTATTGEAGSNTVSAYRVGRDTGASYFQGRFAVVGVLDHIPDADMKARILAELNAIVTDLAS